MAAGPLQIHLIGKPTSALVSISSTMAFTITISILLLNSQKLELPLACLRD